jgi:hypothetical protein
MSKKYILSICFVIIFLVTYLIYNFSTKDLSMKNFSKSSISQELAKDMIENNIWSDNCPVPLNRLSLLNLSYIDFDGVEHQDGRLIVHDVVADHVIEIFKKLYENKFPINSIKLINDYKGDDDKSMEANNTSAFNCRNIANSKNISIHSYGLAIDINPAQNPFVEIDGAMVAVHPALGVDYLNRRNIRNGMVETSFASGQTVVDIFNQHGFTVWGGNWNTPIDWHHFQVTRQQAEMVASLSYEDGVKFFNSFAK